MYKLKKEFPKLHNSKYDSITHFKYLDIRRKGAYRILRALSQRIIGMGKIKVHWGPESQVMTWGKQPPGKHCKMWKEKVNAYLESIHPQDLWCTMLCNGLLGRGLFPLYLFSYLLSLNSDIQRSFKLNFINFFCHQKKKKNCFRKPGLYH